MSPDTVFTACSALASLGWILLMVWPANPSAHRLAGIMLPGVLATVYVVALGWHARELSGGYGTLDAVAQLFTHRWALLAGWIHFLAFDLFIGAWMAADASARRMGRLRLVPLLLVTFLFGPAGLLAYLTLRRPLTS